MNPIKNLHLLDKILAYFSKPSWTDLISVIIQGAALGVAVFTLYGDKLFSIDELRSQKTSLQKEVDELKVEKTSLLSQIDSFKSVKTFYIQDNEELNRQMTISKALQDCLNVTNSKLYQTNSELNGIIFRQFFDISLLQYDYIKKDHSIVQLNKKYDDLQKKYSLNQNEINLIYKKEVFVDILMNCYQLYLKELQFWTTGQAEYIRLHPEILHNISNPAIISNIPSIKSPYDLLKRTIQDFEDGKIKSPIPSHIIKPIIKEVTEKIEYEANLRWTDFEKYKYWSQLAYLLSPVNEDKSDLLIYNFMFSFLNDIFIKINNDNNSDIKRISNFLLSLL